MTTGNYVATVTGGTGITSSGATSGEGIAHSLSVDASQTQITAVGTIATGVWQGTDVGVAYGGTGVSTLTDNAVLTGTGASAITAESNLTFTGSLLTVTGAVTVGVDDAGHDVKFFGNTAGEYMLWDTSADSLVVIGEVAIGTATPNAYGGYGALTLNGSTGGVVDLEVNGTRQGTLFATGTYVKLSNLVTGAMHFATDNTNRLTIEADGDINLENNDLLNVGASGNDWTATQLSVNSANDGGYNTLYVNNSSTSADSRARLVLQAPATSGASDPYIYFAVTSGEDWVAGIDNSLDDKFIIANSDGFGATGRDVLVLDGRIAGSTSYARMSISNANPVLQNSASANFMMLDIPNSDAQITGTTTITHHQPLGIRIQCQRMSASAAVTVDDASHIQIFGVPSADTNVTFENSSAIYIMNSTHGGTVTNQYGIKMDTMTGGGTTNVGIDMGNNTLENVGASGNDWTANEIAMDSSNSGGTQLVRIENTSTTAGSQAQFRATVAATDNATVDATINFSTGVQAWIVGNDNSESDRFAISSHANLGAADALHITTAKAISFFTDDYTTFDYICDSCGRAEIESFECCGTVAWHDDVLDFRAMSLHEESAMDYMERVGVIDRTANTAGEPEIFTTSKMMYFVGSMAYQNRERMDAQNEAMDERLKRI